MELQEITELALELPVALTLELGVKFKMEDTEHKAEQARTLALLAALADGKIDGKNASARSLQEAQVLINDEDYQGYLATVRKAKGQAALHEIDRRHVEARISLVRAWLYAQRPDL